MRILFISHRLTRNGATLALLQELRYLHEHCKDLEFEVFSPYDGPLRDDFKKICPTHFLSNRLRDQLYRHFWTKISGRPYLFGFKKGDFDLIYTNTVTMASIADTLKKEWGIPCILHFHEAVTSNYSALKSKSSILAHDFFIAVSELTKRNLVDYYGISPSKIEIQYPLSHCLDSYLQNNLPIDAVPSFGNKVVIGICGRYDWVKSSDLIPLIIKNFFTQHPDATCHFVYVCSFFSDQEKCNFDYDRCYEKRGWVREENFPLTWISSAIIICTVNIFSSVYQVWPARLWSVSYEYHIKCFTWGTAAVLYTAVIISVVSAAEHAYGFIAPVHKDK